MIGSQTAILSLLQVDPATKIKVGSPVCVVAKTLFLWTANPLRVVYLDERLDKSAPRPVATHRLEASSRGRAAPSGHSSSPEGPTTHDDDAPPRTRTGPVQSFQYAHGTLAGHTLAGEERFALMWDKTDDSVWFSIHTVS